MTCPCGHKYCWRCMAEFGPIRREGNHRHKETCTHYFPWTGTV
jgi:E3 ubiquitin-protein ligase RNF14